MNPFTFAGIHVIGHQVLVIKVQALPAAWISEWRVWDMCPRQCGYCELVIYRDKIRVSR